MLRAVTEIHQGPSVDARAVFRCPGCRGALDWRDDHVSCTSCGREFPVRGGIPRFVESLTTTVEQVQRSFDFEHRRHERSVLTQFGPHLVPQFLDDCKLQPEFFRDIAALDAGCGSGRWSYALAELGANVTAIDLTAGGIESAQAELGDRGSASFAQADIYALPFQSESFDFVMSWGVLHHTPDTRAGFDRLVPLVKPGGTLYVMVYERLPASLQAGTQALRFFMRRMSDERRYELCRHLVIDAGRHPYLATILSRFFMIAAHDPESSTLDVESCQFGLFDAYSPKFNHTHTRAEVVDWFRRSGFTNVTVVESQFGAVKVRGTKLAERRPTATVPRPVTGGTGTAWLARFAQERGRPLRVLHLGNVANNGYLNAKIQRQAGVEADVVSYDYYHVMGCPEWEDAHFTGDVDEFRPDWWAIDLQGYERPRWFVQGSLATCAAYVTARRQGDRLRELILWRRLRAEAWLRCRRSLAASVARFMLFTAKAVRHPVRARDRVRELVVEGPAPDAPLSQGPFFATLFARKALGAVRAAQAVMAGMPLREAVARHVFPTRMKWAIPGEGTARASQLDVEPPPESTETPLAAPATEAALHAAPRDPAPRTELQARFAELFPDRPDQLAPDDLAGWQQIADVLAPAFAEYDVIQAYSTYPIIPLLASIESFAAYEHGTLRDIPFEQSPVGRACALGYREAPVVFVTNGDDLEPARRLGIDPARVVALPHAVDTNKLFQFATRNDDLRPAAHSQPLFFAPARHDWTEGVRSQLKGNDRLIRALPLVLEQDAGCHVVFVEWGRHVPQSKRLIRELGIEDVVTWVRPLRKEALWQRYLASHAVVDQFVMDVIGGVAFEAMALGCRVVTALDAAVSESFFGEAPPLLAAQTPEEIAAALLGVIEDPGDEQMLGARARDWVLRCHSSERIVDLQAIAYERLLTRR
jgi:2-polyprenyl-3-methyl-5-hydroxy-6-metoxy-1,4-benzoquinol methylase/glycosyltransferase involved in cell wall biosynthesis